MYTTILFLHVFSAVLAGGVSLLTPLFVYHSKFSWALRHARATLYGLSAWLVFSGALLSTVSPSVTAYSICDNVAMYFVVLSASLLVLNLAETPWSRSDTVSRNSLIGAVLLFIGTLALGM